MDWWRMNAPRMRTALTPLCILARGQLADLRGKIYGMSKAVLVRGAFALQCTSPAPPVWLTVTACSHACSDYPLPSGVTGTAHTSDVAKWRRDDVCCWLTIHRRNAELASFPLMYGSAGAEELFLIHPPILSKRSVRSRFVPSG